jgi:hypothetical protein
LIGEEHAARAATDNDRMPPDHLTQPPLATVINRCS